MTTDLTTLGTKDVKPTSQHKHTKADRADIGWDNAPCIRLWHNGTEYRYTCTPTEAAAFIRRMSGYIEQLLRNQLTQTNQETPR